MLKKFRPALIILLIFTFFLSSYIVVYFHARSSLIETTSQSINECLSSTATDVNSYIDSVVYTVRKLGYEAPVQKLYVTELNSKSFSDLIELRDLLAHVTLRSEGILDIILVYDTSMPFAISSHAIYHDLRTCSLGIEGASSDDFLKFIRSNESNYASRNPTNVIRLRTSSNVDDVSLLVFNIAKYNGGTVYAVIPLSAQKLLTTIHGTCTYGTPCALTGKEGILYGSISETNDGEYITVPLPATGQNAMFWITEYEITRRITPFTSLLVILLIVFIISIAVIIGLAIYTNLSVQRKNDETSAELVKLEGEMRDLRQSLSSVSPMLRDTLFHKLLTVGYLSPMERSAFLSYFSLKTDAPCRITVIGSDSLPSNIYTEKLERFIKDRLDPSFAFTVYRGQCVIMGLSETTDDEHVMSVKTLISGFDGNEPCAAGASPLMLSILSPGDAYRIAESALHSALSGECAIANPEAEPIQIKQLSYAQLNALYDQIQTSGSKALETFENLVREILSDDLSGINRRRTFERFYEDIRSLLSRIYSTGNYMPEIELPPFDSSAEQPYILLGMLRHMLAGAINQTTTRSTGMRDELIAAVKLYVDEHIGNPDLSLTLLSDEFGMSESGMSRFFKANIGDNFASYLEHMRITEALKLLGTTTLPINEVAQTVGYASVTTFYKAFKRRTGSAPSKARG